MAKKKAAKKATKKKTAPKRKGKARPKGPSSQVLPGMEQVRSAKLDRLCESIGDGRESVNRIRGEEKDDNRTALREMHEKDITVYRHAGVELVRVPGEEKLRVRTTKEDASEITPAAETAPASDEDRLAMGQTADE